MQLPKVEAKQRHLQDTRLTDEGHKPPQDPGQHRDVKVASVVSHKDTRPSGDVAAGILGNDGHQDGREKCPAPDLVKEHRQGL